MASLASNGSGNLQASAMRRRSMSTGNNYAVALQGRAPGRRTWRTSFASSRLAKILARKRSSSRLSRCCFGCAPGRHGRAKAVTIARSSGHAAAPPARLAPPSAAATMGSSRRVPIPGRRRHRAGARPGSCGQGRQPGQALAKLYPGNPWAAVGAAIKGGAVKADRRRERQRPEPLPTPLSGTGSLGRPGIILAQHGVAVSGVTTYRDGRDHVSGWA